MLMKTILLYSVFLREIMESSQLELHVVWAVGMHHHGPRELALGTKYYCKVEPENPFDSNAIAIFDKERSDRVLAYLRKHDAAYVAKLISSKECDLEIALKPVESPVVWNKRTGPQQKCILSVNANSKVVCRILSGSGISVVEID